MTGFDGFTSGVHEWFLGLEANNSKQYFAANRDFFNNVVNWLSQSEERISVRPQDTTSRQMLLSDQQKNFIAWTTIVFLPLLALVGGGVVWWRRR